MAEKLVLEFELNQGQIKQGLAKVEGNVKTSSKKMGKSFDDGFGKNALKSIFSLKTAFIGLGAIFAAGAITKKFVEAANKQEDAINKLNSALKISGIYSKDVSEGFQEYASSLQQVTRFGDEAILENAALLQSIAGLSEDGLKQATAAALDMASAMGMDLTSAFQLVGKAAAGEVSSLSRYGIKVEKGATSAETFANTMAKLNDQFGGSAAADVNTYSGAVQQLENVWGDVFETLGGFFTKSPAMIKLMTKGLTELNDKINEFGKTEDPIGDLTLKMLEFTSTITNTALPTIELFWNLSKVVWNGIKTGLQGVLVVNATLWEAVAKGMNTFGLASDETVSNLTSFKDTTKGVLDEFAKDTKTSFAGVFDFEITEKANGYINNIRRIVAETAPLMEGMKNVTKETTEEVGGSVKKLSDSITSSIKGGIVNVMSQGVQSIVTSLMSGKNAFEAFGKAVLGIVGDLAIKIGTTILLMGESINSLAASLSTLFGGFAIIGGLALIAVGAALKASAGGALTTAAGGTGGPITDPVGDVNDALRPDDNDLTNPGTGVTVNVQGDVFDTQETGLRLADIIQESFDSQGVVVTA